MAKKNKASKASKDGGAPGAKAQKDVPPLVKAIDEQYARGNFAGVRKLAARAGELDDEHRKHVEAVLEMTKTDPRAWLIGAGAVIVVIIAGFLTLS